MILYFTETGNGKYIADKIAQAAAEPILCINDKNKAENTDDVTINGKLILCCPPMRSVFRYTAEKVCETRKNKY